MSLQVQEKAMNPDPIIMSSQTEIISESTQAKPYSSSNASETSTPDVEYRVYGIRWFQLALYMFASITNSLLWITFASINSITRSYYGISTTEVNIMSIVFLLLYLPGSFLAAYCFNRFGVRWGFILGGVLSMGSWIRVFSVINASKGYGVIVAGQILPALGQPFFANMPAMLASLWFAKEQRDIATTVAAMANPLGIAIGSFLPSVIVTENNDHSLQGSQFLTLLIIESAVVSLSVVLSVLFFKNGPPTPPSRSQQQQSAISHHTQPANVEALLADGSNAASNVPQNMSSSQAVKQLFHDYKALLQNRHFLILFYGFSMGLGLFNALTTLIEQIIQPTGYTSDDAGIFGGVLILCGFVGAGIAGPVMDVTHRYNQILKVLIVGVCGACTYFMLGLRSGNYGVVLSTFAIMGFFMLPLLPVVFECAVECSYPISPESSSGLLMLSGQVAGAIFILIMDKLINEDNVYTTFTMTKADIFITVVLASAALVLIFYSGPYLRLHADKDHKSTDQKDVVANGARQIVYVTSSSSDVNADLENPHSH